MLTASPLPGPPPPSATTSLIPAEGNPAHNSSATAALTLLTNNIVGSTGLGLNGMNGLAFQDDSTLWACDSGLGLAKFAVGGTPAAPTLTLATGFPKRPARADGVLNGCRGVAIVPNVTSGGFIVVVTGTSAGTAGFMSSFNTITETFSLLAQSPAGNDFRWAMAVPGAMTPTSSVTPSITPSASATMSSGASVTGTSSVTASPSATRTSTPTPTASATPSASTIYAVFPAASLVVLRVGDPGANPAPGVAMPVFADEYTSSGILVSSRGAPRSVDASRGRATAACTLSVGTSQAGLWRHDQEGFPALSTDGRRVSILCNNVSVGTALTPAGQTRTAALLDAAGGWDTVTGVSAWNSVNTTGTNGGQALRQCIYGNGQPPTGTFWCSGVSRSSPGYRTFSYGNIPTTTGTGVSSAWGSPGNSGTRGSTWRAGAWIGINGPEDPGWAGLVRIAGSGTSTLLSGFSASDATFSPWQVAWESDFAFWVSVDHDLAAFNLQRFAFNNATLAWELDGVHQLAVDTPIYSVATRLEAGVRVVYATSAASLYRYVPGTGTTVIATAAEGTVFRGVVLAPQEPIWTRASPSASQTATSSLTASPSTSLSTTPTPSGSKSLGLSATSTGSPSNSATGSLTATPSPSATRSSSATLSSSATPTPSPSARVNWWSPSSIIALRVGTPSANGTVPPAGLALPVFLDAFSTAPGYGFFLSDSKALPTSYSSARGVARGACTLGSGISQSGIWNHGHEGFPAL